MSPELVVQSLELQSAGLRDQMQLMPKDSEQRRAAERTLAQYDAQLQRVLGEYNKQGNRF